MNLQDLLSGDHNGTGSLPSNLADFMVFSVNASGHLVLDIAHTGGSSPLTAPTATTPGVTDQQVVFNNYSSLDSFANALGLAGSGHTSSDIIAQMIKDGALKTHS